MTGPIRHATGLAGFSAACNDAMHGHEKGVVGIEHSPIFVGARESETFAVTNQDYVKGVSVHELMNELQPDQHLYLVHLDNPGPGLGIKLIRLT